jgi:succinate dehydrogenase / fumarate reductase flavoprotein subunit/fumarate reductase flavoprotein subunit
MTAPQVAVETLEVDVAIIGSGGAGLMAAIHALRAGPALRVAILSKGAVGRSGCSIMVQGYNAALGADDSPRLHFEDAVRSGAFLADQELVWALASDAPARVRELENAAGCYFDRTADGSLDLAAFPGQTRNRKVHRGHETGIEVMGRLRDLLFRLGPLELADVRALELLRDERGEAAGVLALDLRRGIPIVVRARAVVVAAGGGAASLYRVATPAREKSGDGVALCYRAGLELRDMEFVQFLSVGLVASGSKVTGVLLEEALRFAGAHLLDGRGERFMARHDPERMERAPRDDIAKAMYAEILAGRGTPFGAVLLDARPIGRTVLETRFADLVARARSAGRDLAGEPVPVAPASHIGIGGVVIDPSSATAIAGLFVAGEDAGGVHGASWQGGNGIAESTVFGARAGEAAAAAAGDRRIQPSSDAAIADAVRLAFAPLTTVDGPSPFTLSAELRELMWERAGLVRDEAGLAAAAARLSELDERVATIAVPGPARANPAWQEALDLRSSVLVARLVVEAARVRRESRGMHTRTDHPERDDRDWLRTVVLRRADDLAAPPTIETRPIVLDRLRPDQAAEVGAATQAAGATRP